MLVSGQTLNALLRIPVTIPCCATDTSVVGHTGVANNPIISSHDADKQMSNTTALGLVDSDRQFNSQLEILEILSFLHDVASDLSGSHGEWTCEDDMPGNRRGRNLRRALQATRTVAGRVANQLIAAQTGVNLNQLARRRGNGNGQRRSAPVATSRRMQVTEPAMVRVGRGIRIKHREFIGDIVGNATFTINQDYIINPADQTTFPWLHTQATSWEKYRFLRLRFYYVTRVATSATGTVMLIPLYDAKEQAPDSEAHATAHVDTVQDVVWTDVECAMNIARMGGERYVSASIQAGDQRTSNAGKLVVATDGCSVLTANGKLWVEYEVELTTPVALPSTPSCSAINVYRLTNDVALTADNVYQALNVPFTMVHDGLDIDRYMTATTNGHFNLPRGSYLVTVIMAFYNATAERTSVVSEFAVSTGTTSATRGQFDETVAANAVNTYTYMQVVNTDGGSLFYSHVKADWTVGGVHIKGASATNAYHTVYIQPI